MKKFSSYGPINTKAHYYAPRSDLIKKAYNHLIGEEPSEDGHYITIWAPRQTGKTWLMRQVMDRIKQNKQFEVAMIDMQPAKNIDTDQRILNYFILRLEESIGRNLLKINNWEFLYQIFTPKYFPFPFILLIDEFDSLNENHINQFASAFRAMYISRANQSSLKTEEKDCMLHGLALIGIRSVLGIENESGSPFNVQRSVKIPNFTKNEVNYLFESYELETHQAIETQVKDSIYDEFRGQPGLTCWFGEMLTEQHNEIHDQPINMKVFKNVYGLALYVLNNNNILNIISKAKVSPYKEQLLELFRTDVITHYSFKDPIFAYLYMMGIIDYEAKEDEQYYVKFHCPYIQKSLFSYFSREIFRTMGKLMDPFSPIDKIITPQKIDIKALTKLYENYLKNNKVWLLKDAPRRTDLRIYEAVYHFNFYMFLTNIIQPKGQVFPEFPTGNGKVDLLINYLGKQYALELKTFTNISLYNDAITQASKYANQLNLHEITLVFFIEAIDDKNRQKYEQLHVDNKTGVRVDSVFVVCG